MRAGTGFDRDNPLWIYQATGLQAAGILTGHKIIRDNGDLYPHLIENRDEGFDQRSLARPHRATDPDAGGVGAAQLGRRG